MCEKWGASFRHSGCIKDAARESGWVLCPRRKSGGGSDGLNIEWSTLVPAATHTQNTASKSFPSHKAILSSETNLILCQSNQRGMKYHTFIRSTCQSHPLNSLTATIKGWTSARLTLTSGFLNVTPSDRMHASFQVPKSGANHRRRVKEPPGLRNTGIYRKKKPVCWTS